MTTKTLDVATHCGYCGRTISPDLDAPERFGERFCSNAHADDFVAGVRAARIESVARTESRADQGAKCGLLPTGQRTWRDDLKRGASFSGSEPTPDSARMRSSSGSSE